MLSHRPSGNDAEANDQGAGLLLPVEELLATLVSYPTTLQTVARLVVPHLADYCVIDMFDPDGGLWWAAAAHRDPEMERLLLSLRRHRLDLPPDHPVLMVLRTGRPQVEPIFLPPRPDLPTHPEDQRETLRALAPRSAMRLPLTARGQTLGVLSCYFSDSGRRHTEEHERLGLDFARRCALAVDNARLYEAERSMRHAHEAALDQVRQREARLNGIIGAAMDAIITIGLDRRIQVFNAAAERMFGYASADAMGRHIDLLLPERFRGRHAEHIRRFGETGATNRRMGTLGRLAGRRANGQEFPVEATISRVNAGGDTLLTVVIRDVTERVRAEERQRLLAEAGAVLASSLDYEVTLERVASLAVPVLADYCFVDILEHGRERRIAGAPADPAKAELVARLREFPPDLQSRSGAPAVLRTGMSQLEPEVTEAHILAMARSPEHLAVIHELGPRSRMFVPLIARGQFLGAIAFVFAETDRRYTPADLAVAEELARRCALAIDNARLYQAAQAARQRAEAAGAALSLSEAKYRGLFEAAPVALLVLDRSGAVRDANPAAGALFERPRERLNDLSIDDLCGPGVHERLLDQARSGRMPSEPLILRRNAGPERYLQLALTDVVNQDGEPQVQVVVRDVTLEVHRQAGLRAFAARILRAQEEERTRIAHDLHDDTIQTLIHLCRLLDAVEGSWKSLPEGALRDLSEARRSAEQVVAGLRNFARALRPPTLRDLGLVTSIERLLLDLGERTGVKDCLLVVGDQRRLPDDAELTLFRIAQEALRNVERHAEARSVTVTVGFEMHQATLEVVDDGKGFALPSAAGEFAASGHLGLLGMQERAQLLGGKLEVQSSPGSGATVCVSIPVPALAQPETGG